MRSSDKHMPCFDNATPCVQWYCVFLQYASLNVKALLHNMSVSYKSLCPMLCFPFDWFTGKVWILVVTSANVKRAPT